MAKTKDIQFEVNDFEFGVLEYKIPEGFIAEIKDGKVVLKKKESEDERIRKSLVDYFRKFKPQDMWDEMFSFGDVISYLEKQKEYVSENFDEIWNEEECSEIIDEGEKLTPKFKVLLKEICHAWYDRGIQVMQKEQKPNIELIQKSWYLEGYHDGKYNIEPKWLIQTGKGGPRYEENQKYGTQKPAEWSEEDKARINHLVAFVEKHGLEYYASIDKVVAWLKDLPNRFVIQPKEEWCEEDEEMFDNILLDLSDRREKFKVDNEPQFALDEQKCIDWFQELPNRFDLQPKQEWSEEDNLFLNLCKNALDKYQRSEQWDANIISNWLENRLKSLHPQPKQEWSEEDERILKRLIRDYDEAVRSDNGGPWGKVFQENLAWLKSIRPQPHWKPSVEQMEALDYAQGELCNSDIHDPKYNAALCSLIDTLKKL